MDEEAKPIGRSGTVGAAPGVLLDMLVVGKAVAVDAVDAAVVVVGSGAAVVTPALSQGFGGDTGIFWWWRLDEEV